MQNIELRVIAECDGFPDPETIGDLQSHLREFPSLVADTAMAVSGPGAKGDAVAMGEMVLVLSPVVLPSLIRAIADAFNVGKSRRVSVAVGDVVLDVPVDADQEQVDNLIARAQSAAAR